MQTKIEFINERSKEIYEKKEHVLIGISPCNSYYNREKIEQIINWVLLEGFQDFHFFLADEISKYNFLALGYLEKEALRKAKKEDNHLYNKVAQILEKKNISKTKIISNNQLINDPIYIEKNYYYRNIFQKDQMFESIAHNLIQALEFQRVGIKINYEIAIEYCFAELPLLLNIPDLLKLPSSCVVYHDVNRLHTYLYNRKKTQAENLEFTALKFV